MLVGAAPEEASRYLEGVRLPVSAHRWTSVTGDIPVTVSIGAASAAGMAGATAAELLSRADAQLYQAKRAGRDRVDIDAG